MQHGVFLNGVTPYHVDHRPGFPVPFLLSRLYGVVVMPITLGCPSCGKRFRARDESAGKKVKCPYCQAAVQVPTPDDAPGGAGMAPPSVPDSAPVPAPLPRPVPPSPPARPLPVPPPKPVLASPDDWGALPSAPAKPVPFPPPLQEPAPEPFPPLSPGGRGGKDRPKPAKLAPVENEGPAPKPAKKAKGKAEKTPEEILARGWRSVRRGLFWVQFALLWLSIIGFVEFGKSVYVRAGNELPKGDGTPWVSIEGYVNDPNNSNAPPLTKPELLNLACYGVPVLMGSLMIVLGRMVASGAPRNSGARGLFSFSAMFGLVGFAALFGWALFDWLVIKDVSKYTRTAVLLIVPLAEFWFLTALTASGVALKRPKSARSVGAVGFVFALAAFVVVLGWDLYAENWRPKKPDDEVKMYEQGAFLLGWLLMIGMYWRAVRSVRVAAREYLEAAEDGRA